jgi:large subunit ribosomal protein L25
MKTIALKAWTRDACGKEISKKMREEGFIPAVVYGKAKKSLIIKVSKKDLLKILGTQAGENVLLDLKIEDAKKEGTQHTAMIKEIQYHPVNAEPLHIDFYKISLKDKIKVKVPIHTKGEAAGVKQDGGILEHILWELEIECLPTQIPEKIDIDVNALKIGDSIFVKDLSMPSADIKVLSDAEQIVVSCAAPAKEEEIKPEEAAAAETAEPEVIKQKKPLEEGAQEAEAKPTKEAKEAKEPKEPKEPKKA